MKKAFILIAAMLLACTAAMAQNVRFAVAEEYAENKTAVCTDDGRTFALDGKVIDIGIDKKGNVWTLTDDWDGYNYYNWVPSRTFRVYKNGKRRKSYTGNENEKFFSMAMKVKDGHVVIAGSKVLYFNKHGFEACMMGEVDFERKFETEYVRKSLKRENFRGFKNLTSKGKLELPAYDQDNTYEMSVYYGVKDVDYYDGDIYATGWGEREYTKTYGGSKYYFVRRCPRIWKNGRELAQQVENETGAAYSINVMKSDGKLHVFTSGHNRGTGCGWDGINVTIRYPFGEFPVDKEAVIIKGSTIYHCCIVNHDLCFAAVTDRTEKLEVYLEAVKERYFFRDVVADPANNDFYVLAVPFDNRNVSEVWRLHCASSILQLPKKVFTFQQEISADKLAVRL